MKALLSFDDWIFTCDDPVDQARAAYGYIEEYIEEEITYYKVYGDKGELHVRKDYLSAKMYPKKIPNQIFSENGIPILWFADSKDEQEVYKDDEAGDNVYRINKYD